MEMKVQARRLFLLRHGETDWNVAKRLQGRHDIPLNERGRLQARRHGTVLKTLVVDPDEWTFVSSPLGRACETMEIVRLELGLPAKGYQLDEQIVELGYGAWEGKSWDELRLETPEIIEARFANPWATVAPGGGEHHQEMQQRVVAWYEALPEKTVAVTHSGPTRIVRGHVSGLEPDEIAVQKSPQDLFLDVRPDQFLWV